MCRRASCRRACLRRVQGSGTFAPSTNGANIFDGGASPMRHGLRNAATGVVAIAIAMMPLQLSAQSGSAAVNTQMSLFLAGGNVYTTPGGDGISPFEIILAAG